MLKACNWNVNELKKFFSRVCGTIKGTLSKNDVTEFTIRIAT